MFHGIGAVFHGARQTLARGLPAVGGSTGVGLLKYSTGVSYFSISPRGEVKLSCCFCYVLFLGCFEGIRREVAGLRGWFGEFEGD